MTPKKCTNYVDLDQDIGEIIISAQELEERIIELGNNISQDYQDKCPILIGVLKGVLFFMADLLRAIHIPVEVDFLAVSRYSNDLERHGMVKLEKDLQSSITGRNVLFVEDVIDSGLTLNYLLRNLRERNPSSLEVCVLFNKPANRLIDIPLKYKGFDLPDRFVVGYGLDYRERYRNLPYIGMLNAHVLKNH